MQCGWRRRESIAGVAAKVVRWWRNCCGDCSVVGVVVIWERCWGDLVVVGDGSDRGCGDGGVVGVVAIWGAKLVVVMVVEIWLVPK